LGDNEKGKKLTLRRNSFSLSFELHVEGLAKASISAAIYPQPLDRNSRPVRLRGRLPRYKDSDLSPSTTARRCLVTRTTPERLSFSDRWSGRENLQIFTDRRSWLRRRLVTSSTDFWDGDRVDCRECAWAWAGNERLWSS